MKKLLLTGICIFSVFVILTSPEVITEGVRQGIKLVLYSVIPALLPFIMITNIMMKYNLCEYISFLFYPVFSKIFKFSRNGCFAAIIGFTCGYPMGAKIVGDLYESKMICISEARYLVTFCNNCSISFLLNYIIFSCIAPTIPTNMILLLVYLPALISGFINKFILKPDTQSPIISRHNSITVNPITNTLKSLSTLSIYIICFTVIAKYISSLHLLSPEIKCCVTGFLEITSGAKSISHFASNTYFKNFFILLCTVFGGVSIMFQSFSTLSEKSLKKYYLFGKLEQALIYCVLYVIFNMYFI